MRKAGSPVFDTGTQQDDLPAKITVALERIAEVFRILLWEQTRRHGLSPLQIQILIFLHYHAPELRTPSYLSREFNMSRPTISDAIGSLEKKELLERLKSPKDQRSYRLELTAAGRELVPELVGFADPLRETIDLIPAEGQTAFFLNLLQLIERIQNSQLISHQRMCLNCRFFSRDKNAGHCSLLQQPLRVVDLRVDCLEFEGRDTVD